MKLVKTITILLLAFTGFVNAQKKEPMVEKVGNMLKVTFYHENGEIAQIGCLKNRKLQGEWTMYSEDGKKIALGHYHEGKRTGEWFYWKTDGDALREVYYEEGRIINVIEWSNSAPISL